MGRLCAPYEVLLMPLVSLLLPLSHSFLKTSLCAPLGRLGAHAVRWLALLLLLTGTGLLYLILGLSREGFWRSARLPT